MALLLGQHARTHTHIHTQRHARAHKTCMHKYKRFFHAANYFVFSVIFKPFVLGDFQTICSKVEESFERDPGLKLSNQLCSNLLPLLFCPEMNVEEQENIRGAQK